jgi:hypothetical protein
MRFHLGDALTIKFNFPTIGGVYTGDYINQRCLPCPVGTDETNDLTRFNFQVYIINGPKTAKLTGYLV